MQQAAELVSMALTIPTIVLGLWVAKLFSREAGRAACIPPAKKASVDWIIMGIAIGFIGGAFDNLYWAIPWTASYLDLDCKESLMNLGVYFNIPSRQICGSLAAYCHIRSAAEQDAGHLSRRLAIITLFSLACGVGFALTLFCMRAEA